MRALLPLVALLLVACPSKKSEESSAPPVVAPAAPTEAERIAEYTARLCSLLDEGDVPALAGVVALPMKATLIERENAGDPIRGERTLSNAAELKATGICTGLQEQGLSSEPIAEGWRLTGPLGQFEQLLSLEDCDGRLRLIGYEQR